MRALALAALAFAGVALADAPQPTIYTALMVVMGWDARTHDLVYSTGIKFPDLYQCEEAREWRTPPSTDIVEYVSLCLSPTDIHT